MDSSDPDDEFDPRLRDTLRSLPTPETPRALESRVRDRIRRRRVERVALLSGSALALIGAVFVWQPWREDSAPVARHNPPAPPVVPAQPREIPPDQLAVLFAPPPVDSLTIVGGRNEGWVAALERLEDMK